VKRRRSHRKKSSLPSTRVLAAFGTIILVVALLWQNNWVVPEVIADFEDPKCPQGYVYQITTVCIPIQSAEGGGGGGGDQTDPTVSISSPQNNQEFASGTKSIVVMGIASDNIGVTKVEVAVNNGPFIVASGTGAWQTSLISLSDGNTYTLTVRAIDAAGNTGSKSVLFKVKADNPPPPDGDRDNDGILDSVDLCPDDPETINGYLDSDGCPDQPPPPPGDYSKMRGTNLNSCTLFKGCWAADVAGFDANWPQRQASASTNIGINTWRINVEQEKWVNNKAGFISHLQTLTQTAKNNGINVFIDFFQLNSATTSHAGFPSNYFNGYALSDTVNVQWWTDFYNDGKLQFCGQVQYCAWNDHYVFMKEVILATKQYDNVIGYEIINEPYKGDVTHFQGLGDYHTYIAQKMVADTSDHPEKKIIFTGCVVTGCYVNNGELSNIAAQAPMNINREVWYLPHNYNDPTKPVWDQKMTAFKTLETSYWKPNPMYSNIKYVGVGEWAIQNNGFSVPDLCSYTQTQKENLFNVAVIRYNNDKVMSAYWQAGQSKNDCGAIQTNGIGNSLWNPSTGTLTQWGTDLKKAFADNPVN